MFAHLNTRKIIFLHDVLSLDGLEVAAGTMGKTKDGEQSAQVHATASSGVSARYRTGDLEGERRSVECGNTSGTNVAVGRERLR